MGIITASQGFTRIKYNNMCPGNGGNFCVLLPTLYLGSWKFMDSRGSAEIFCLTVNPRKIPDSSAVN